MVVIVQFFIVIVWKHKFYSKRNMGQILHCCAHTNEAVRRAIQNSQKSIKTLAAKYSISPKNGQLDKAYNGT